MPVVFLIKFSTGHPRFPLFIFPTLHSSRVGPQFYTVMLSLSLDMYEDFIVMGFV